MYTGMPKPSISLSSLRSAVGFSSQPKPVNMAPSTRTTISRIHWPSTTASPREPWASSSARLTAMPTLLMLPPSTMTLWVPKRICLVSMAWPTTKTTMNSGINMEVRR